MNLISGIKKFSIICRTIAYLKITQIFYQIKYRLVKVHNLEYYQITTENINWGPLKFNLHLPETKYVTNGREFDFLNLSKYFEHSVNWNFQDYGKLWNYNLQYFNYLHQDSLPDETKVSYLTDISQWLEDGRLKLEPYPVSLRVMNVIRYLSDKKKTNAEIIKDTYSQLNYLNNSLEYHLLANHLLENAFALLMGGCFFRIKKWQSVAKELLYDELNEQVLNDGGHFELSPMYHQIILFRLLELIDWYGHIEDPDMGFLLFVEQKAIKMINWLNLISFKNGDIPHFNDSTNGIAFSTKQLLSYADELQLTYNKIHSLTDSGYRKYITPDYECVIDIGQVWPSYQPGHSHADMLSFILYVKEIPFIVDTGISTYQIGELRNMERSTYAHNTVAIEGKNQSEIWGGFRVGRRAKIKIIDEAGMELTASHDGYKKDFGATHQRTFAFGLGSIIIKDKIIDNSAILAQSLLHFHPDRVVTVATGNLIIIDNIATINFIGADKLKIDKYQSTIGFNKYRDATCIVVDFYESLELVIKVL